MYQYLEPTFIWSTGRTLCTDIFSLFFVENTSRFSKQSEFIETVGLYNWLWADICVILVPCWVPSKNLFSVIESWKARFFFQIFGMNSRHWQLLREKILTFTVSRVVYKILDRWIRWIIRVKGELWRIQKGEGETIS